MAKGRIYDRDEGEDIDHAFKKHMADASREERKEYDKRYGQLNDRWNEHAKKGERPSGLRELDDWVKR